MFRKKPVKLSLWRCIELGCETLHRTEEDLIEHRRHVRHCPHCGLGMPGNGGISVMFCLGCSLEFPLSAAEKEVPQ